MVEILFTNLTMAQKIELSLNILNHAFIAFVTIFLSYICFKVNLAKTALHAWLCTMGYNCLMAEAILCHYSGNILTYTSTRKTKTTLHWILMVIGGSLGIIGAIVKIVDKTNSNKYHFTTVHGVLGLIATLLSGFACVTGASALFSQNLKTMLRPILTKTVHNLLGICGFFFGMLTMYYGYETGFFQRKVNSNFADLMKVFTLISLTLSLIGPLKSFYNKILIVCRGK